MVRDVEGNKEHVSLSECWRWIKGLLYDFISLKKEAQDKKAKKALAKHANKSQHTNLNLPLQTILSKDENTSTAGSQGLSHLQQQT